MTYHRNKGENEEQYIWRICLAKDKGEFAGSWDDVAVVLNKELRPDDSPYTSSAYRKKYQMWKLGYDKIFAAELNSLPGINRDLIRLQKEKKKIQSEKVEINRWIREDARDELIMEKIIDQIELLNDSFPLKTDNEISDKNQNSITSGSSKSWVLAFGDAHYGAEFIVRGLNGEVLNKYNPEIFVRRMDKLLNNTIQAIKEWNINKLYVFDLGDCIDGILRASQLIKLRFGVVESTIRYAEYISEWLNELSSYCEIEFQSAQGNHSELRMLGLKKGSFPDDNMGKIINVFLKERLINNKKIKIITNPSGKIYGNIQGFNLMGIHGETKNLEEELRKLQSFYKINIDFLIAGHLHHSYSENVGFSTDVMRTPSIIGVDGFSEKLLKSADPGATMFAIEKNKGKILEYNIKL